MSKKKSSHNVHLLVLVHNISRLYVEVGDHNLVLAPTSILAVIYSSELEKVSLDFWSGVVVFLIRHHHVTFKSSELERHGCMAPCSTRSRTAVSGTRFSGLWAKSHKNQHKRTQQAAFICHRPVFKMAVTAVPTASASRKGQAWCLQNGLVLDLGPTRRC